MTGPLRDELDSHRQMFRTELKAVTGDRREAAWDELEDAWGDLADLRSDNAYIRHLQDHVADAVEDYTPGDDEPSPCSCDNPYCPVSRGKLPSQIRNAESTDAALSEWIHDRENCNGHALRQAREDWITRSKKVIESLERAIEIASDGSPTREKPLPSEV